MHTVLLILCGLVIGFILISLGMGAALYIGCLITLFHLPDKTAAASALVVTLPALIIGTLLYRRKQTINYHLGNKLLCWAILGTIGGSLIVPIVNQYVYHRIVSLILIILALTILAHSIFDSRIKHPSHLHQQTHHCLANLAGVVSGVMIGLAGMSGGGPLVAGMLLLDAPIAQAAATSSYIRVWTTILGIGLHFHTMTIAWHPVFLMTIGTVIGASLAPIVMQKIGIQKDRFSKIMKPIIALILLYMGL